MYLLILLLLFVLNTEWISRIEKRLVVYCIQYYCLSLVRTIGLFGLWSYLFAFLALES